MLKIKRFIINLTYTAVAPNPPCLIANSKVKNYFTSKQQV